MEDVTTDRLVGVFLRIRNARTELAKTFNEKDEALKEQLKTVEVELLRRALEQGVEGFKTEKGTTYIAEEWHTSIEDNDAFDNFVLETGDLGFFERRVTIVHVREYMKEHDGQLPPGLHVFRENRMRVRVAAKKKGEVNAAA